MYCPHCNSENPEGVKFCVNCGRQIENSVSTDNTNQDYNQNYNRNYNRNYNQSYQQPNYNQAQPYQQHVYVQQPAANTEDEHMTVGGWIGVFCINLIPFVGTLIYIIMMFVWAFGNTPKKSLKTFARAQLLIMAIVLVLVIILFIIIFAVFSSSTHNAYSYYSYY